MCTASMEGMKSGLGWERCGGVVDEVDPGRHGQRGGVEAAGGGREDSRREDVRERGLR